MRLTDRTGLRYGRLVVIRRAPNKRAGDTNARWFCKCDCGKESIAYGGDLQRGKVKSCGCWNAEDRTTHGMAHTKVYTTWQSMNQRCHNPRSSDYGRYGGIGITVCDKWRGSFEAFFADMGFRRDGYTLDRIDNSKGYFPGNCRWATYKQQNVNRRNNVHVTIEGVTRTISQWLSIYRIYPTPYYARLKKGLTPEQALAELIAKK